MSYLTGDSLKVRIRIAFGASIAANPATWAWTDVTPWWHTPDDVTIAWGRSSGAEQPEHSTLSLTLKNTDGRFTAYDARSPYWPRVRKWTPISYDVDLGDGAGWRNRFSGYIRRWPLTWPGASPLMALAKIEAWGVLGRLGRGKPPARSAMRRTIPTTGALAYWPIEDGADASQVGSAYPGHAPLSIVGPVTFASIESWKDTRGYEVRYGSAALADVAGGVSLSASVPSSVTTATGSGWTVAVTADTSGGTRSGDYVLLEVNTPGGTPYVRWRLVLTTAGRTQIIGYTAGGAPTWVVDEAVTFDAMVPHNFTVFQDGAGVVRAGYWWSSVGGYAATGSTPGTISGLTSVSVNPTRMTSTVPKPVGHLAVWAGHDLPAVDERDGDVILALFGYGWTNITTGASAATGEPASARLARLLAEDGLTLDVPGVTPADEVMMGVQHPGTPLALYQQCETSDQGLLYESGFGLGYTPRMNRYNAPVTLTIDAAARQLGMPFEPVDDDQMLRNLWTVERIDGSSAVAVDQESVELQGEIEGSASVSLASDANVPDHAWWRLHQSTVQEPRYPAVSLNLATHPQLAAAWCACKPGSRIQVVNPPEQNVPGVVDQVVVGASETYRGRRSWKATLNVVPASPWQVAAVDGNARIGADGSATPGLSSSGMSLLLTSTTGSGLWTEDPADFPLDMRVGGEQVTADGARVVDAFDRTGSGGLGGSWTPAMGSPSAFSTDGVRGVIGLTGTGRFGAVANLGSADQESLMSIRSPVTATGGPIVVGWMARYLDTENHLYAEAEFRPDGRIWLGLYARVASVNSTLAAPVNVMAYSAGTTYRLGVRSVGDVFQARVYPGGTPPAYQVTGSAAVALPVTATWAGPRAILTGANTNTQPVQVTYDNVDAAGSAAGPSVVDTFTRTVAAGGWGTPWTVSAGDAADVSVNGSAGLIRVDTVNDERHMTLDVGTQTQDLRLWCTLPVTPTGAGINWGVLLRYVDANNYLWADAQVGTTSSITIRLIKRLAGVVTVYGTLLVPTTHSTSVPRALRAEVNGPTFRARVWSTSSSEPDAWDITATDTAFPSGTRAGAICRRMTGNTNSNPTLQFDNVIVAQPQLVTLSARGVNGVQRVWPAGTEVNVWAPAVAGL